MLPRKMRSHDRKQVHPPQSWVRSGHSNSHRLPNIGEDDAPHARGSGSSSPKPSLWGASRFPCRTNWKRGSTSMPAKAGSRSAASWPGQWRAFWMEEGSHRGLRTQPASKRQGTTWRVLRPMSRSSGAARRTRQLQSRQAALTLAVSSTSSTHLGNIRGAGPSPRTAESPIWSLHTQV